MTFLMKVEKAVALKGPVEAIASIEEATSSATVELMQTGIMIRVIHPTRNLIAVLKMKASGLCHYSCNRPYLIELNIGEFFAIVSSGLDDDILTISSNDPTSSIFFTFKNPGKGQSRHESMGATETSTSRWTTDESAYQYWLHLPSHDFRDKFNLLKQFDHTVKITLSEKVARLSAGMMQLLVRKEAKECLIEGVEGEGARRRKVRVSLEHLETIVKGSQLSVGGVWIYNSTAEPPIRPLISCPLGTLGTLLFFLPRPFCPSSD